MQNIYIFGYKGQDGSIIKSKIENIELDIKFFLFAKDSLRVVYKDSLIQELYLPNEFEYFNLVSRLIRENKPKLIFYLAAFHLSSTENENNINIGKMFFTNYALISFILNQCLILGFKPKIIYASSSLIFSGSSTFPQNEYTKREPRCNYSQHKVLSEEILIKLGKKYNIPVLVAIFYNHESIKRKEKFFTKKVISYFSKKFHNKDFSFESKLTLFNPDSIVDMGYADEYMDHLLKLTFSNNIGSYIFSSGCPMTVKSFVNYVSDYYGLSDEFISYSLMKPRFKIQLVGDNRKLTEAIGCIPTVVGKDLVNKLCNDYENYINN